MRRLVLVLWLVAVLGRHARADGSGADVGAGPAPTGTALSPWIDHEPSTATAPAPVVAADPGPGDLTLSSPTYHPLRAQLTVGGMYAAFAGWMYFAWYKHHADIPYKFGGDDENCDPLHGSSKVRCVLFGWAGDTTYAGGEDKFGHAWATMALARLTDEILEQWGGFGHHESMYIGTGLSWLLFLGVEVRDGFNFEFSYSDLGGDTVGALVALALMQWPTLDEMFDYRVQYFPSQEYLRKLDGSSACPYGGCSRWDIAEDYSGEKFILAYHLSSIHRLRDMPTYGVLSRFIDVDVGFDTRNYKPTPDASLHLTPYKEGYIGLSFNAQGFFDWLLDGPTKHPTLRKVTHGLGEVFNLPYTSVDLFTVKHSPCPTCTISNDGAL